MRREHDRIEVCFKKVRNEDAEVPTGGQKSLEDAQAASGGEESRRNTQKANCG